MADTYIDRQRKIMDFLDIRPGNHATGKEISEGTGIPFSQPLFKTLNGMKKIKRLDLRKGQWFLRRGEQATQPAVPAGSTLNFQQRQARILECLRQQQVPVTAITVARSSGLSRKEVNSVLYKLSGKGLVVFKGLEGNRPVWSLGTETMAETDSSLFRDTSSDTSAPGAYSPERQSSSNPTGSTLFSDRQEHRHSNRPYPYHMGADFNRHPRTTSGSGNNVAMRSILSSSQQRPEASSSRHSNAVGNSKDSTACDEGLTVSVPGSGGRTVSMAGDGRAQAGTSHSDDRTGDQGKNDEDEDEDGDDYFEDDGDSDYYEHMESRYQDMMGDLVFEDMTFVEDEDNKDSVPDEDFILVLVSLQPDHTMNVSRIAQVLEKTEEEIFRILKSFRLHFRVSGDTCILTENGSAVAKDKANAYPFLERHVQQLHDHSNDHTLNSQQLMATGNTSAGRVPLPPKELIQNDPVFGVTPPPKENVRGRGRGLLARIPKPSQPGMIDVRDLEAQCHPASSSLSPPPSYTSFSSSQSMVTSSMQMASSDHQKGGEGAEVEFRSVDELNWQPLMGPKTNPVSDQSQPFKPPPPPRELLTSQSQQSQSLHALQGYPLSEPRPQGMVMTSQMQHPFPPQGLVTSNSQPANLGQFTSMPSALHKFTQEGLTVLPKPMGLGSYRPPEPIDMIEHQMGKTGLTAMSDDSVSMEPGMPRCQSLPLLGSAVTAGDAATLKITSESFAALNKNPISALMEYAQSRRMQALIEVVTQRGPSHRPVFLMAARVGNRQFPGVTCHNKKVGRKEAADVALRTLIAEGQYSAATPTPSVNIAAEDMTHFDKIAALTHQTFNSLIASIPENLAGRKVIAGLVMKRSEDDVGLVISIGTGNRCITGDKLSLEGNTVNDSHAEIITRRGFMRFLYQQLQEYQAGSPHDLFEPGSGGKLRVKAGITFHLYISTAPCGDGALFSPRDVESNSGVQGDVERRDHCPTFTSNVQGLLRTKMEGGEGTIPVDTKQVTIQTWDGVVRGERLRTMSCTDKICRWNVLGLQGALLSHYLEPIYMDSLTLGFLYDHGHLSRAVCCRLAREEPPLDSMLPVDFHLNHPWLGRVTACQPLRETQKTKAFSINWTLGDPKPEVLDGTLGHCYTAVEKQLFSRVAKRSLYDSFKQVAQHLGRSDLLHASSYRHSKMAATNFQAAKTAMIHKFQQQGCGWVKKPVEEEMFS